MPSDVTQVEQTAERLVSRCHRCGLELPLRPPDGAERAKQWSCCRCGTRYSAVLLEGRPFADLANVQPAHFEFDRRALLEPPGGIVEYLRRHLSSDHPFFLERRDVTRYPVAAAVAVMPVDVHFNPLGSPWMVVARDLSKRGMGVVSSRAVRSRLLVVELSGAEDARVQLVLRVLRCRPVQSFYEIGGEFLTRIAGPEEDA